MPIKISIIDDFSSILRGTKKLGEEFDDVADSLDDMARDAQRAGRDAGDDLSRGIERGTDDAGREVDRLEKSFREMARDASRHSKAAGDDLGDSVKRGADRASDAAESFKDEATQNFAETASSFDGSMDSIAEMAQGTLGGLATAIPGAGVFAAAAAAAGGAWFAQWQQAREDSKESYNELLDAWLEAEGTYLSESFIQQQMWDILKGESRIIKERDFQAVVRETGMTEAEVALAFAGNADAMAAARDRLIERQDVFQAQLEDEIDTNDSAAQAGLDMINGMIAAVDQRASAIQESKEQVEQARAAEKTWGDAAEDANGRAARSADEARAMYDGLGRKIAEVPSSTTTRAVVEIAEAERRLGALRQKLDGLRYNQITVEVLADLTKAEQSIRGYHPVIEGVVRAGQAVV